MFEEHLRAVAHFQCHFCRILDLRKPVAAVAVPQGVLPPADPGFYREFLVAFTQGYVAFLDPPKETAATAIAALNKHGVTVKVLTGDNELVTRKVCREVGLSADEVLLGSKVETMNDDELAEAAERIHVFARLSPAHKQRIIHALQQKKHVVGFMGDGINDAPALRAADVGISVDTAVDIAKESADVILLEKVSWCSMTASSKAARCS